MPANVSKLLAGYRQQIGLTIAFVLVAAGFFAIGYAAASQQRAPMPPVAEIGKLPPKRPGKLPILGFSKPVSIKIPAIGATAKIISIGKNKDGTIAVPEGDQRNHAAWYKYSPTPGEFGASVIEGHLDTYSGPSVFFNLGKMRPGDDIIIERADRKVVTFEVTAIREYEKSTFPAALFYSGSTGGAELHLITCAGDYSGESYDKNLAVYAQLKAIGTLSSLGRSGN